MSTNWLEEQFSLDGKVALVTGASKGIGAEIAISMALAGADLILMGRSDKSLGQTAKKISEISSKPREIHCDLSDLAELEKAIFGLESKKIDVLVNNAGTIFRSPSAEMPDDEWHRLMDINVNS